MGGDYYTGEYDYTIVDGSQPETPTGTADKGQVTFKNVCVFHKDQKLSHFLHKDIQTRHRRCL